MPRFRHLSSAVAVALAFSGAAQAQSFDNYFVFGDSLSDAGNVGDLLGLPAGSSFTTNSDPVYAQIIGANFGFDITNGSPLIPGATGTDFAVGGACANPDSATFFCTNDPSGAGAFSVTNQLNNYLAGTGGHADPNALYSVWSGANDIFSGLNVPNTRLAATTTIGLITQLQNAGARYIIVFNLPNLGITPDVIGTPNASGATTLSQVYNDTFNAGLGNLGDGIIPVDVYGLISDVIADPGLYGFTDVTHKACGAGDDTTSVNCGPETDPNYDFHYAPGTNDSFLFADSVHPTGAGHRLLAAVVLSELAAPGQISMLGEAALNSYEGHARVIHDQIWDGFGADRPDDSTIGFAHLQSSNFDYDPTANTPSSDMNQTALTVGADYRGSADYNLGGALTLGSQQLDIGSARASGRVALFSVYGVWNFGHGYVNAVAGGGSDNFEVHRHLQLGPADRVHDSDTNASHVAVEIGGGYQFGDDIKHGPFADVTWQKIDVGDIAEIGFASTIMRFSGYTRDSLISRIGYQLRGTANSWHPFARLAYNNESRNDPSQVTAGLVNMNGHFTLPGLVPADHWWTADLGVTWDVNDSTSATVGYSGLFSDDVQNRNTINLGVNVKF